MALWSSIASLYRSPKPSPKGTIRAETNQNDAQCFDKSMSPSPLRQSSSVIDIQQRVSTESVVEDHTKEDDAMSHCRKINFTGSEKYVNSFCGKANAADTFSVNGISASDSSTFGHNNNQANGVANEGEAAGCMDQLGNEDEGETTSTRVIDLTGVYDDDFASVCSVEQERSYAELKESMSEEYSFHDTIQQQQQQLSTRPPMEISIQKSVEILPSDCDKKECESIMTGKCTKSHNEETSATTSTETESSSLKTTNDTRHEIVPSDGSIMSGRSTLSHNEETSATPSTETELSSLKTTNDTRHDLDNMESRSRGKDHASYLNQRIATQFNRGIFFGTIVSCGEGLWHILYDDDDEQDMDFEELKKAQSLYSLYEEDDEKDMDFKELKKGRSLYQTKTTMHKKQSANQPKAKKLPYAVSQLKDTNRNGLLAFAPQTWLTRDGDIDIAGTQWECSACNSINVNATVCHCGRRRKSVRATEDNLSSIKIKEWGSIDGRNADCGHVLNEPEFYLRDNEGRSAFKSRYRLFVCQVFISIDAYERKGSAFARPNWMVGHPEENEPGIGYYKIRLEQQFTKEFFSDLAPPGFQLKTKASELGILFVNTKSGCCDTHYDDPSLFLAVLSESKKLYLGHPTVQKILTQDKTRHRYFKENPFCENNTGWTEQLEAHPGDGVIIPSKWLHSIWSDAGTVALSVKIDRSQKGGRRKARKQNTGHDLELVAEDYENVVPCDDDCSGSESGNVVEQSENDAELTVDLMSEKPDAVGSGAIANKKRPHNSVREDLMPVEPDVVGSGGIARKKRRHNRLEECTDFCCKRSFLATPAKLNESHSEGTPSRRLSRKVPKCLCNCGCSKTFSEATQMWVLCTDSDERAQKHLPRHLICSECWPMGPHGNNGLVPPPPDGAGKEDNYRIGSKHEYRVFERNYERHLSKQYTISDSPNNQMLYV